MIIHTCSPSLREVYRYHRFYKLSSGPPATVVGYSHSNFTVPELKEHENRGRAAGLYGMRLPAVVLALEVKVTRGSIV